MQNISSGIRGGLLKTACICLAILMSGSLFSSGLLAVGDCHDGCCCRIAPHHLMEKQMPVSMDCCSKTSENPCDMQAKEPLSLPDVASILNGAYQPDISDVATALSRGDSNEITNGDDLAYHKTGHKFRSPPLFIQNQSFLI